MSFTIKELPYAKNALEPAISEETITFHYDKHLKTYLNKLNNLTKDTDLSKKTLEEVILQEDGPIYNNAAQIWNHDIYWYSLSPKSVSMPKKLQDKIEKSFDSLKDFETKFKQLAMNTFGSGWVWLVQQKDGEVSIISTSNAANPLGSAKTLLGIDVWEHAYYIDYRNDRAAYMDAIWPHLNWEFAAQQMD